MTAFITRWLAALALLLTGPLLSRAEDEEERDWH